MCSILARVVDHEGKTVFANSDRGVPKVHNVNETLESSQTVACG